MLTKHRKQNISEFFLGTQEIGVGGVGEGVRGKNLGSRVALLLGKFLLEKNC